MPNCPHCTESTIYAKRSTAALAYPLHLEEISAAPFGRLVRCPECGSHWYEDDTSLTLIPEAQLPAARSWTRRRQHVSDEDFALLAGIGSTYYGMMSLPGQLSFPVRATINGKVYPTAALRVYRGLPAELTKEVPFHWYADVTRLEAGERALNPAFRASRLIETDVFPLGPAAKLGETPDGHRLPIDPGTEYYLRNDLSDEAVRSIRPLDPRMEQWERKNPYFHKSQPMILADWDERFEELHRQLIHQ